MKEQVYHIFVQLISDQEFICWARSGKEERTVFWQNWAKGSEERNEAMYKAFDFLHRVRFRHADLQSSEKADMLEIILKDKPTESSSHSFNKKNQWMPTQWIKVAAILLLSLLGGYTLDRVFPGTPLEREELIEPVYHTLQNPKGRRSEIKLPDGSMVHLSHESELIFPKNFFGGKREVFLKGEAFFDIVRNDTLPFIVRVQGLDVKVLGTSFNVKSKANDYQSVVSLVTGKVNVGVNGGEDALVLQPGEQVSLDLIKREINVSNFHVEKVTGWKDGIIHFRDAGMDLFIEKMEEWYGVNFQVFGRPARDWKINAKYQGETLEEILLGLQYVYGIEFKINRKKVWMKINENQ